MSIRLHIEHLIVDGVQLGANGAVDLQQTVQEQLTHLLTDHRLGLQNARIESLPDLPPLQLTTPRRTDPLALGSHVAQSLHAGLQGVGASQPALPSDARDA